MRADTAMQLNNILVNCMCIVLATTISYLASLGAVTNNPIPYNQPHDMMSLTYMRRILQSRILRWVFYLTLSVKAIQIIQNFTTDPSSLQAAQAYYASTNPWRDLPPDQEQVVKEVLYIAETLRDTFLPISLPEEDDYDLLSSLLRSLETRRDVSWTTFHETGVDRTLMAIANRPASVTEVEPAGLAERFAALHEHWSRLAREPGKPERWEVRHDVTFLPPLVEAGDVSGEDEGMGALLGPERVAEMEDRYAEWHQSRDRKVSYLKTHPPRPLAWVPVLSSDGGGRDAAWADVLGGGVLQAGKRIAEKALVRSPAWKPFYRDLLTENVPYDWQVPGEKEMTEEEYETWKVRFNAENGRREERRGKQAKLVDELAAKRKNEGLKDEL